MTWRALSTGLMCCLACCAALSWGSVATARDDLDALTFVTGQKMDAKTAILDIRDGDACAQASLPRARCLPVDHFIDADGKTISFHALRWLLGTVGLSGAETVLVVGATAADAATVGALLYLAGQRRVRVLDAPFTSSGHALGGEPRSFSRETVFTAPMRDAPLLVHPQNSTPAHTPASFAAALARGDTQARLFWP